MQNQIICVTCLIYFYDHIICVCCYIFSQDRGPQNTQRHHPFPHFHRPLLPGINTLYSLQHHEKPTYSHSQSSQQSYKITMNIKYSPTKTYCYLNIHRRVPLHDGDQVTTNNGFTCPYITYTLNFVSLIVAYLFH